MKKIRRAFSHGDPVRPRQKKFLSLRQRIGTMFHRSSILSTAQTSQHLTQQNVDDQSNQSISQAQDEDHDDLINSSIIPPPMIVLKQEQTEQNPKKVNLRPIN
ncbi:hypothetical protein BpHYR1_023797 [Brachionus plicatilis]|uniref:Uncharacterized protein n=1 Tax=Brachionus plicatilis TaxID=10195 RepID=A0A3M7QIC7_BRAPC|nr:hypothetical protein BpHYR1_023797 [Brachionus plicatilis]